MKTWKIYIVSHKKLNPEFFLIDPSFKYDNYCILNVGSNSTIENSEGFETIHQFKLVNAVALGKWWAESEGIYNIWRSGIYRKLDYIGFLHYDKELTLIKKRFWKNPHKVTKYINDYIRNKDMAHISFENHSTIEDYGMRVLADVNQPNKLTGEGRNCYEMILEDYNKYFNTKYTKDDLFGHKNINLCSCFFMDTLTFDKMMNFFDWIVQSKKLDVFDTQHQHRLQGGLAERYFGVFLLFEYSKHKDFSIIHRYNEGLK